MTRSLSYREYFVLPPTTGIASMSALPNPDFSNCRGMLAMGNVVAQGKHGRFRAAANTGCIRKARQPRGVARNEPAPARV
jgi:hypothetical protein